MFEIHSGKVKVRFENLTVDRNHLRAPTVKNLWQINPFQSSSSSQVNLLQHSVEFGAKNSTKKYQDDSELPFCDFSSWVPAVLDLDSHHHGGGPEWIGTTTSSSNNLFLWETGYI